MSDTDLCALLWRERTLLELLGFKLDEQHLVLSAGRTQWVGRASNEIEAIMQQLSTLELERDVQISTLGAERGVNVGCSLQDVIDTADESWSDVYVSHRNALLRLADQIKDLRDVNERLLRQSMRSTQETLAAVTETAATYDAGGKATHHALSGHVLERDV